MKCLDKVKMDEEQDEEQEEVGNQVYGATVGLEARFETGSVSRYIVSLRNNSLRVFSENDGVREELTSPFWSLWYLPRDDSRGAPYYNAERIFWGDAPSEEEWMEVDADFIRGMFQWSQFFLCAESCCCVSLCVDV